MIWRLYYIRKGGHVHCRLFCGPQEGALGKCGDLTMRHEEFTEFTRIRQCLPIDFRAEEAGQAPVVFHESVREFIRSIESGSGFKCAARAQSTAGGNDPTDCDWPFCSCDPYAAKVIAAIEESDHVLVRTGQ